MAAAVECGRWKNVIWSLARDGLNAVTHAVNLTRLVVAFSSLFVSLLRLEPSELNDFVRIVKALTDEEHD